MATTRLERSAGKSNEFWEITTDGASYTVRHGKIGSAGRRLTKRLASAAEVDAKAAKLIASKRSERYVRRRTPTPGLTARHPSTVSAPGEVGKLDTYLDRFVQMVEELRENPLIEVTRFALNPPASAEQLEAAKKLPPGARSFYERANGLELEWRGVDGETSGSIKLLPVQEVFGSWKGVIWFDEEWDDKSFRPLHPLDFFQAEACAALYLDGSDNPRVYYHYCGEEMEPMETDFAGYLEMLLQSRGFHYWQTAVSSDRAGGEERISNPAEFRKHMPRLFADFDPKDLLTHDYTERDAADAAAHDELEKRLNDALTAAGAAFEPKQMEGHVAVRVDGAPENLQRVEAALAAMGHSVTLAPDFGAVDVGGIWVERAGQ